MRTLRSLNCGRFVHGISVLFTGTLISSVCSFVTQLVLTHSLTVAEFGRIAALLAAINLVTPLASAGVNWSLLQAFGREGWGAVRWLRPSAMLVGIATCLASLIVAGYALRADIGGTGVGTLVLVTSIPILVGQVAVELASCRFQLEGRYERLATWQTTMQTGRLAAAAGVALAVPLAAYDGVLVGFAIVGALTGSAGGLLLRDLSAGRIELAGHPAPPPEGARPLEVPSLRDTAAEAAPFALMTIFYLLYFQGGVILLEWLCGGSAAAIYNAAFLLIAAIFLIPNVIYMRLLVAPLCRWAEHDRDSFAAALHAGVPAMAILGTLIAVATALAAAPLVPLLFGAQYAPAVPVLQILAVGIPIRFVQSAYSSLFVSKENMVRKVKYLSVSAAVGIAASLWLIPRFGAAGAAVATTAAEAILLGLHIYGTQAVIPGFSVFDTIRVARVRSAVRHLAQHSRLGA